MNGMIRHFQIPVPLPTQVCYPPFQQLASILRFQFNVGQTFHLPFNALFLIFMKFDNFFLVYQSTGFLDVNLIASANLLFLLGRLLPQGNRAMTGKPVSRR